MLFISALTTAYETSCLNVGAPLDPLNGYLSTPYIAAAPLGFVRFEWTAGWTYLGGGEEAGGR